MRIESIESANSVQSVWAGYHGVKRRRGLRILPKSGGYYVHVISRIVGREFLLGETEKKHFYGLMRSLSQFSGIGVVTYCLMDNHFHILLYVPESKDVGHGEVLRRLGRIWPEEKVAAFEDRYQQLAASPEAQLSHLRSVTDRMGDLPEFMRLLKLQFTRWYNRLHDRKGVLWESRYRSVVVEGSTRALTTVATYIDLNPVRAGIVADPKDYRWSGYAEAVRGKKVAQQGLTHLVQGIRAAMPGRMQLAMLRDAAVDLDVLEVWQAEAGKGKWTQVHGLYRCWLYAKGWHQQEDPYGSRREQRRKGFSKEEMRREFVRKGELAPLVLANVRVRYLTDGVALGSEAFLQSLMLSHRSCFGPRRSKGGSRMCGDWQGMRSMRDTGG